ncbi:response regulator transcription factor [Amycolatopsis taiwanensis]|uniref:DNA-binding response regulator n=1 Tax=Amycolatopsis taiwanensis TaxID=342230 RepID=A0A9W6QW16_9PSEU|nr:response regulator transcription factor [Amycolatopsis taiwanensis]GLY65081.1 DNA-binding response regulator [Amycolatopsis taiwanensis]
MARLLIIEDDETIGGVLESSLRRHGFTVRWERGGRGGLAAAAAEHFDLVLLDLGLPDLDGVDVCRRLRAGQPLAVLVILTARHEEMDVIVGLEAGADDYLTKPVRLAELLARVRAHLRRGPAGPAVLDEIAVGGLRIDLPARRVFLDDREIPLRAKEFDLLARLAQNPGTAVSRDTLMTEVWDAHWHGSTKTLDVHIAMLRRKLAEAAQPGRAPRISTLRGHGYRLDRWGEDECASGSSR